MQKITPFIWFNTQAEEAANFYVSLFNNSKITATSRYNAESAKVSGMQEGSVMVIAFELEGVPFSAINGGPAYTLSPAISFTIDCKDQAEVDHFWNAFAEGGTPQPCGWITDRFGLSWQVIPSILPQLMQSSDPEQSQRVMHAMLQMSKIDIAELEKAAQGE